MPLPRLPEAQRQRLCLPGALAGEPSVLRGRVADMGEHRRQRPMGPLSLLSDLRIDRYLRNRGDAGLGRGGGGGVRRSVISGTGFLGLGGAQACLGCGDWGWGRALGVMTLCHLKTLI